MSRSIEEWLRHVREVGGVESVTRVLAMHDRRSADALFEIRDETDLGILAERIDAMYANAGVTKFELCALDDRDRTVESYEFGRGKSDKRRRARPDADKRARFRALLKGGDPIELLKGIFESDERLFRQLEAATRRR